MLSEGTGLLLLCSFRWFWPCPNCSVTFQLISHQLCETVHFPLFLMYKCHKSTTLMPKLEILTSSSCFLFRLCQSVSLVGSVISSLVGICYFPFIIFVFIILGTYVYMTLPQKNCSGVLHGFSWLSGMSCPIVPLPDPPVKSMTTFLSIVWISCHPSLLDSLLP